MHFPLVQPFFLRFLTACICISLIPMEKTCLAQASNYNFEHLTTDHGLASNKVEAVLQDREGFYWIATQNGLNRFDGTSFKIYRHDSVDSTSLTHNYCTALLEGKNGDIWVGTYNGVSRFIKNKGCFQPIFLHHPSNNFEITNRIYHLAVDRDGNIWIAGNGLWKYVVENDSIILFEKNIRDTTAVYSVITQLVYDPMNKGLWFSTGDGLAFISVARSQFYHKKNNPMQWKVFDYAGDAAMTLDNKNRFWFIDEPTHLLCYFEIDKNQITRTGKVSYGIHHIGADDHNRIWIFNWVAKTEIFDPETGTTDTTFFSIHHKNSILSEKARLLYIDKQNNYWIASGNGISIYKEGNQYYKLHTLPVKEKDFQKEPLRINALAQNEPEILWIATNLGLFKYNLTSGSFKHINVNAPTLNISSFCVDGDRLWMGIYDQLWGMDTRSERIVKKIYLTPRIVFIRKSSNGDLWAGLWTGGLYRIRSKNNEITHFQKTDTEPTALKSNNLITGLAANDVFWIGYNSGFGFSKYSISSNTFTHYHPQEKELFNSNAGTINVITMGSDGYMWLGTRGSGIFRYDPTMGSYENYQQQQGLNSNYINSIISDGINLWISTADGMNYINSENQSIRQLNMDLVFPDNDYAANGIQGLNDKLYFFCKNEFVEINPLAYKPDQQFPRLVISSFKIFDTEVPVTTQLRTINLSYRENFFSFEYSTVKTNPLKEVNYAFMLEGFDKNWNLAGHQQNASYTNVPGGHYRFMIKATNSEGQWSDALLSIPVIIRPPFWRTWWFAVLCVGFIAGSIYMIYWYRIRQIRRIYSIKSKISQDLHDEVGSTLSSIHVHSTVASKALDKNIEITKKALNHIHQNSRLVMDNMSDIVWAINRGRAGESTLEDKLKNYGYELLTPLNINVMYDIDTDAEKILNHFEARKNILLIVKEAMNNIAKYSKATEATVRVEIMKKHLLLRINDNGIGFSMTTKRNGNGLFNMQHRTETLGGKFVLRSEENKGTSLTCSIPIANISNM